MSNASTDMLLGSANGAPVLLRGQMANRHGLVAGATGTGKTITLQVLAESFSRLGVPVFTADVKGDLSGMAEPIAMNPKIEERLKKIGISDYAPEACPVVYWDIFGEGGHPVRTTMSEMGPVLLAHLMELNDVQTGVLQIAFSLADDQQLLILDIKDLRELLSWMNDNQDQITGTYGNISSASIGAIQRALLVLEESGGRFFFGEPALKIEDLMMSDFSGRGVVSMLDGRKLILKPRIYATFLLWLLSELFENLEEVGDADLPRLVFFFDEAHLLFDNAPKPLLEKIEQVVRLIRSKGVGIYFVTQNPDDVPQNVLGQLGNKVQHALRAFTPRDRTAIKAAAESFRPNPELDTEAVLTELGVGEALVSVLDEKGSPTMVQRTLVAPPRSKIGPIDEAVRTQRIKRSPFAATYTTTLDRESAYEVLQKRRQQQQQEELTQQLAEQQAKQEAAAARGSASTRQTPVEAFASSMLRTIGSTIGREVVRGVLGTFLGKRR